MLRIWPHKISIYLYILTGMCGAWSVQASDFTRVEAMLANKQVDKAYSILSQKEDHHLGEPEFDLLLGRAALASGHHHEAIFAYERVLLSQPGNDNARFGLAVAYYRINENKRAMELFEVILSHKPPEKVIQNIQQYVNQIQARQASLRHKLSGKLSLRTGWDSNINSATNNTTFELLGNTFALSDKNRETESPFTELAGLLNYRYTINNNANLFSHLQATKRGNHNERYDTELSNLQAGGSLATANVRLRFPLTYQSVVLDDVKLRTLSSVAVELSGKDSSNFITSNLQYAQIRYPEQTALNNDMTSFSLGYVSTNKASTSRKLISLYYGDENAASRQYDFNTKTFYGVQGRLFLQPSRSHLFQTRLTLQKATYQAKHPLFSQRREDQLWSASLGWTWRLNRAWSLESKAETSRSKSTEGLYNFRRHMISLGINYHL